MNSRRRALVLIGLAVTGCSVAHNYTSAVGPRYAGGPVVSQTSVPERAGAIRIVTFNVQFAQHVDRAIALLDSVPDLRGADILTLQEMDAPGTERIAGALGMSWVYYPATVHPTTHRDFGDAILSRWPIVADEKIILPHLARLDRSERIAVAATLRAPGGPIRVYSLHLGTMVDESGASRRDQMRAVLTDAQRYARVVIGGDLNSHGLGRLVRDAGYRWPTERGSRTSRLGRWDHIFLKGFSAPNAGDAGTVLDNRGASDHRPVWVVALLEPAAPTRVATSP